MNQERSRMSNLSIVAGKACRSTRAVVCVCLYFFLSLSLLSFLAVDQKQKSGYILTLMKTEKEVKSSKNKNF